MFSHNHEPIVGEHDFWLCELVFSSDLATLRCTWINAIHLYIERLVKGIESSVFIEFSRSTLGSLVLLAFILNETLSRSE